MNSPTPGAPRLDFVFTVCDKRRAGVCPIWPGQPMTAHWGVPDPAAVSGIPIRSSAPFAMLSRPRPPHQSVPLPPRSSLDKLAIKKELNRIGQQ